MKDDLFVLIFIHCHFLSARVILCDTSNIILQIIQWRFIVCSNFSIPMLFTKNIKKIKKKYFYWHILHMIEKPLQLIDHWSVQHHVHLLLSTIGWHEHTSGQPCVHLFLWSVCKHLNSCCQGLHSCQVTDLMQIPTNENCFIVIVTLSSYFSLIVGL